MKGGVHKTGIIFSRVLDREISLFIREISHYVRNDDYEV